MKYGIILFVLSMLISSFCHSQEFHISDFADYTRQVNLLENDRMYEQAIKLTNDVWESFPEKEFELMKELIWLNGKTGRYEKNLAIWEAGHHKGFFFLLNKRMKKYAPYLDFPKFEQLMKQDEKLRLASFEKSQTIWDVVLPEKFKKVKNYPVLMILHGGGSNLEQTKKRWKILPVLNRDYIVVFLQSYRQIDSNTFGWTSGDERAHRDIKFCYNTLQTDYPIDTTRILLGGVSAGGTMAFDIAFNNIIPVKGIITFCPGKPWHLSDEKLKHTRPVIYMIGGETDFYRPKQDELVTMFKKAGLDYKYNLVSGMGHEFPSEYDAVLVDALQFIEDN